MAGVGAWKLDLENPLYALQKRVIGYATAKAKSMIGRKKNVVWKQGHYPRDYCAMYRRDVIVKHNLSFLPGAGGFAIAEQLWNAGYSTRMVSVRDLAAKIVHIAHGTAAVVAEKPLNHRRAQNKVERRVAKLFCENWIKDLREDELLDHGQPSG